MSSRSTIARLVHISWRNIFRNRRRTFLTLGVLMIGCMGMMTIGGLFESIMDGFRDQYIQSQTGHFQVNVPGYYQFGSRAPLDYLIKDPDRMKREIEAVPGVDYVVPRLKLAGMASSDKTSVAVLATGTDPELEKRMGSQRAENSTIPSIQIVEGRALKPGEEDGALLGQGLMAALGLKVGDTMTFLTSREEGAIDGGPFRIVGTFQTIIKESDDRAMTINLSAAQKILGAGPRLHSFQVLLHNTEDTEKIRSLVRDRLAAAQIPAETHTWIEMGDYYKQSRALLDKIYLVIIVVFCVVFFFSIGNTVNMALMERIKEFGTMMAMGNSRFTILTVILMESVFLGLLGGGLGVLLGWGLAHLISAVGIEMPPPPQGTAPYLALIILKPGLVIQAFCVAFFSTVFSSFLPAYRTVKYRIVDALGHV